MAIADTPPSPPDRPEISVLLAVHNGARYVESALRSVMDQTVRNIEIVVVDDCSTDDSPAILRRLAAEDPRIRIVTAPHNLKLAGALNLGLDHVRAPLVARMDDDDLCLPTRLEVQKRFMDAHPEVTLVGTSIQWIDADGRLKKTSIRSRDTFTIAWSVRFFLNVSHPTFMFRPTLPDGTAIRYDPSWTLTEDHELVCRLIATGGVSVCCLPDVLLRYRSHGKSVSRSRYAEQMAEAKQVAQAFQHRQLPADLVAALVPLGECYFDFAPATPDRIAACFRGMQAMLAHDIAQAPDRAAWLRRQSGQFLAWSLRRGGASGREIARAFLRHWPGILPAMALRAVETRGWMPAALHSDPDIRHAAPGTLAAR